MATTKKKTSTKKRKPKGKPLSESLRAKDAAKHAAEAELERERAAGKDDGSVRVPRGPLAGEPSRPVDAEHDEDEPDEDRDEDDEDRDEDEHDEDEAEEQDEGEREHAPRASGGGRRGEDEEDEEAAGPASQSDEEEGEDDEETGAAQMGHERYVIAGFFGLWLVGSYILGRTCEGLWGWLATKAKFIELLPRLAAVPYEGELVSRASVSLVLGAVIGGVVVAKYYLSADVRKWADEVAEELGKVKWPTRKEIGNHTVVVITAAAVLTAYLSLLDRFWAFVTNLIYSTGT